MSRASDTPVLCLKLNYKRKRRAAGSLGELNFKYVVLLNIYICLSYLRLTSAAIFFREANEQVRNGLKNDRPCNFLLGPQDAHLTTPETIARYGYPVERHWATTDDGYILEMHRIPRGVKNGKPSPAVFLQHGVLSSSRDFVINCERRALAFMLYENGFDVWLGNYRGTPYGRNHTSLKVDSLKFWDFSVDQVGYYDIPAMIDYVLNTTKLKKISLVGHSMGNGITLVMLTLRPEYNDKINFWFAMSASVSLQDTGSPLLRIFAAFPRTIESLITTFNHGELIPSKLLALAHRYLPTLCRREGRIQDFHGICSFVGFVGDGYDPGQIPPEFWTVVTGSYPTSTSGKFIVQWFQWIISGDFAMFDGGPRKNMKKYGSVKPKRFPIEKLRTPAILFWGENDWIVSGSDIKKTEAIVTKLRASVGAQAPTVEYFKVASPHWNHADFIFGKDADILVYSHILRRLRLIYEGGEYGDDTHQSNRTTTTTTTATTTTATTTTTTITIPPIIDNNEDEINDDTTTHIIYEEIDPAIDIRHSGKN